MKRHLTIDGRDEASFDQNGAIKSHLFDQRWKAEMSPRCALEGMRRFDGPSDLYPAATINRKVH